MHRPSTPGGGRSLRIGAAAFAALICLVLVGLDGLRTWRMRGADLEAARIGTDNLSRSLAQHANDMVQTVDAVLQALQDRVEADGTGPDALPGLRRLMAAQVRDLPVLHGLLLVGPDGERLAGSSPPRPGGPDETGNADFRFHRVRAERGPHFSGPVRSRVDGDGIILVSRRIDRPDGSFGGVVVASLSIRFFGAFYDQFDVGLNGCVALDTDGGRVLVRHPFDEDGIGQDVSGEDVFRAHVTRAPSASFEFTSTGDDAVRLGSYHRLQNYPLLVIVGIDKAEALADWHAAARIHLAGLTLIMAVVALLCWRLARQEDRRARAESLYRLLAENSSDAIICVGLDGARRYASPAFTAMTGWTGIELLGRDQVEIVHPEDRPALEAEMAKVRAGSPVSALRYRYLRRDGTSVWVETRVRTVPARSGAPVEFVGNVRDISRSKALEDQLARANAELLELSSTDALTGLANRRRFDETLAREWDRAAREQLPLSVLMLDADQFKAYNDRYGHAAGDECLRAVSRALGGAVRRPADLVARYGGEEFAAVLPSTEAAGAETLAEQVRAAVLALGIAHAGSGAGVVTLSVGVASAMPRPGDTPDRLLQAADRALYRAKRTGRNRVETARAGVPPGRPVGASPRLSRPVPSQALGPAIA